jgi:hypothetical protein
MKTAPVLLTTLVMAQAAMGAVIAGNFEPHTEFIGIGVEYGNVPIDFFAIGVGFSPAESARLTRLDLPLLHVSGPNAATVLLMKDVGGRPHETLEEYSVLNMPVFPATPGVSVITNIISPEQPMLIAGQRYWIIVTGATPESRGSWLYQFPPTEAPGPVSSLGRSGEWFVNEAAAIRSAFAIIGEPASQVPEPGSMVLIGLGLVLLSWNYVRRDSHRNVHLIARNRATGNPFSRRGLLHGAVLHSPPP